MKDGNTLSIVIPAYNEEEAIEGTVRRCLDAIPEIQREAALEGVEVIVVNDGSYDRTPEIVRAIPGVRLISHERNRGYGAAIKTGFQHSNGGYIGFLDGDGTCDPLFFGKLVSEMKSQQADVSLGSRLHDNSKMPLIRRVGNTVFARLLSILSGRHIQDSASGMRVLARRCLIWIPILPDGLHFTPAMSALSAFDPGLKLIELPMPYDERQGRSKLSVIKDGIRFLRVILSTAFLYIPFRFFAVPGLFMVMVSFILVSPVFKDYIVTGRVEEWAFYRLFVSVILFLTGLNSFIFGLVAHNFSCLIRNRDYKSIGSLSRVFNRVMKRFALPAGVLLIGAGVLVNREAFVSYFLYGKIYLHWSRVVFGGLLIMTGVTAFFYYMLYILLDIIYQQKVMLKDFK